MDFIVEYIDKNFADLLEFDKEIMHIDNAAIGSVNSIKKTVHEIKNGIDMLDIEIQEVANLPRVESDR